MTTKRGKLRLIQGCPELRLEEPEPGEGANPRAHPWQAQKLRYWRQARGVNPRKISELIGISGETWYAYEQGKVQMPYDKARKIAAILRIRFAELWDHTPPPELLGENDSDQM